MDAPRPPEPTVTMETIGSTDADTERAVPAGAAAGLGTENGEEVDFPIADYDELRVSEILPLIPELELDELGEVRERELAGKRRAAVIDRIDDQMDELEGEAVAAAATPAAAPAVGGFPIADYDERSVDEIIALIPDLSDDELDMLAEREEQGQNRAAVLDAVDDQFEEVEIDDEELVIGDEELVPVAPVPAEVVPAKVTARNVGAKKLGAKKVGAKKVGAKKLGVKKLGVKKLGVKKLGVKRGPAKKVAVKAVTKAPTKRVAAKKVPTKRVAAKKVPAKTPTKTLAKTPAKKVLVKKAPARKVSTKKVAVKKVGRPAKKR